VGVGVVAPIGVSPYQLPNEGLKFNLGQFNGEEKEMIKRATVTVNGAGVGHVGQFDGRGNKPAPLPTGDNVVVVRLADGREYREVVPAIAGHVTILCPVFRLSEDDTK
jgi:uncharacterized protein YfaP (DUF2135 family)